MPDYYYSNFTKLLAGLTAVCVFSYVLLLIEPASTSQHCDFDSSLIDYRQCTVTPSDIWKDPHGYDGKIITVIGNLTFNIEDFSISEGVRQRSREIWVTYDGTGDSWELFRDERFNTNQYCVYNGIIRGRFFYGPSGHRGFSAASINGAKLVNYTKVGCFEGYYMPVSD